MDLHNPEAEKSILGAILLEPDSLADAARIVHPGAFYQRRHALLFATLQAMDEKGVPPDLVTVTSALRDQDRLEEVGGSAYLAELVDYVPTAANIAFYSRRVQDLARRRALVEKSQQAAKLAREAESFDAALDQAEADFLSLRQAGSSHAGPVAVSKTLLPAFKALERIHAAKGGTTGTPTGFKEIDQLTCGLQPGDLIIVAARPSMGKTALALNIADHAASNEKRCLVFSLEMSQEQLVNRLIAGKSRVDANRFRNGQFLPEDWSKMTTAANAIKGMPLFIDDSASPTVFDIRAKARRVMRDGGLDLVPIDYLQLMRPAKAQPSREREVAEISRSLKALAKELEVPVVVLAQLNRAMESGATIRRPVMSDLRESGSLEQDADLVLFPWREAAYCQDCRRQGLDCGKGHYRAAEVIVGKQRNGPVGTAHLAWLPEFTRFENLP